MDTPYQKLLAKLVRADVKFIIVGGVAVALNGLQEEASQWPVAQLLIALVGPVALRTAKRLQFHCFFFSRSIGTKRTGSVALSFNWPFFFSSR